MLLVSKVNAVMLHNVSTWWRHITHLSRSSLASTLADDVFIRSWWQHPSFSQNFWSKITYY